MAHPKIQEMLDAAERDVRRLRNARSSAAAREAWSDFLEHANRAINRLEGYSKRTGQHDKYLHLITKEVWATPLTKYMRVARNAHEHGVEELNQDQSHDARGVFPNGRITPPIRVYGLNEDGTRTAVQRKGPLKVVSSPNVKVTILPPGIMMIPILSPRGEEILPPLVETEAPDEHQTAAAAREYLAWVTEQIGRFA